MLKGIGISQNLCSENSGRAVGLKIADDSLIAIAKYPNLLAHHCVPFELVYFLLIMYDSIV